MLFVTMFVSVMRKDPSLVVIIRGSYLECRVSSDSPPVSSTTNLKLTTPDYSSPSNADPQLANMDHRLDSVSISSEDLLFTSGCYNPQLTVPERSAIIVELVREYQVPCLASLHASERVRLLWRIAVNELERAYVGYLSRSTVLELAERIVNITLLTLFLPNCIHHLYGIEKMYSR